jgi:hypothetical protein
MKVTVTIEITDSVFRGLVAESNAAGISVNARVAECVAECVPPLKHAHQGDWARAGLSQLSPKEFTEVRRRAVINEWEIEAAVRRYIARKHFQTVGLRLVQQEFEF